MRKKRICINIKYKYVYYKSKRNIYFHKDLFGYPRFSLLLTYTPSLTPQTKVIYQMHSCSIDVFFPLVFSTRFNEKYIYNYTVLFSEQKPRSKFKNKLFTLRFKNTVIKTVTKHIGTPLKYCCHYNKLKEYNLLNCTIHRN